MANTSQIKQDYFKLLQLLNKGNKKTNEKTEVYFYIEQIGTEYLFFAAISLKQRILLVRKNNTKSWGSAHITGLAELEDFISSEVKKISTPNYTAEQISECIKSALFQYIK